MREEWLATLAAHVDRMKRSLDPRAALDPAMLAVAQRLSAVLGDGVEDLPAWWTLGQFYWQRGTARMASAEKLEDTDLVMDALGRCFAAGLDMPHYMLHTAALGAADRALQMLRAAEESPDPAPFTAIAQLWQRIIAAVPVDQPFRPDYLVRLSATLAGRFQRTGDPFDLDAAITIGRQAVDTAPEDDPDLPGMLRHTGFLLQTRYGQAGGLTDLDAALAMLQRSADLVPGDDPERASSLALLGSLYSLRFQGFGRGADLDSAAVLVREAVLAVEADDERLPTFLVFLGETLVLRAGQTGSAADLDEGISSFRRALDGLADDDIGAAQCLSGLCNALRLRFAQSGDPADLDGAVTAGRQSLDRAQDAVPVLGVCLLNLGGALQARAGRLAADEDTAEALTVLEGALAVLPADSPLRVLCLNNLSWALREKFQRIGSLADLDVAIVRARQALAIAPGEGPTRFTILRNLCIALSDRYEWTVNPADLQEALQAGRSMVAAIPAAHPDRAGALSTFGSVLNSGYQETDDETLLAEAIGVHREALALISHGHPDEAQVRNNLGNALADRFRRLGERRDIEEAVTIFGRGAEAADGSVYHGLLLLGLGRALLTRMGEAGEPGDLDQVIGVFREAVAALPEHDRPEGQSALARALCRRFTRSGHGPDLEEATMLAQAAVDATPAGHPNLSAYRPILGEVLTARPHTPAPPALASVSPEVGDATADATRSGLIAALATYSKRINPPDCGVTLDATALADVRRLTVLLDAEAAPDLDAWARIGFFQWVRFLELAQDAGEEKNDALNASIHAYVPLFLAGRTIPWQQLIPAVAEEVATGTGTALLEAALAAPALERVDQVIDVWRRIMQALPAGGVDDDNDDDGRLASGTILGTALSLRYAMGGGVADLEEGITLLRQTVDAVPLEDPAGAACRGVLGEALMRRFTESGDAADLDQAIAMTGAAVTAGGDEEGGTAFRLQHGATLLMRSRSTGNVPDLESAIGLLSQAVGELPADDPDHAAGLAYLADALCTRFGRDGDEADLQRSLSAATEAAAALPDGHPNQANAVLTLGLVLVYQAVRNGSDADLDAAIGYFSQIAGTQAPERPAYLLSQVNLAVALHLKFLSGGGRADLNAAIDAARQVLRSAAPGFPGYATAGINLGSTLLTRFAWDGDGRDLDEAIDAVLAILDAYQQGQQEAGQALAIVTIALHRKAGQARDRRSLTATISLARRILARIPDDLPDRELYRAIIVATLRRVLYLASDTPADLDQAIGLARQAARLAGDEHPLADTFLAELAAGLHAQYELSHSDTDFTQAQEALQRAINVTEGANRAEHRMALGALHAARFLLTHTRDDHLQAIAYHLIAAEDEAARPWTRISAAQAGALLAAAGKLPDEAADLLEIAVLQLPLVVSRHLARAEQQRVLSEFASLASDAAALRIEAGGEDAPARALSLLELGRAVLHGQALDMRQDLIALHVAHPALAKEYAGLRDLLNAPTDAAAGAMLPGPHGTAAGPDRHSIAERFAVLLNRIRALDGFGSFLLPPPPRELIKQAVDGPIVVFNVSAYRCDALVVTRQAITTVPLPDLTLACLADMIDSFNDALNSARNMRLNDTARAQSESTLSETLEWLWDVATRPVLDQLGHVRPHRDGTSWPRVWWVPGGLLGMLPLHAAGYHQAGIGKSVLDRVVSSYTPTVRALAYTRSRRAFLSPERTLIVAMPTTPGQSDLEGTAAEAAELQRRLPSAAVLIERAGFVDEATPTHAEVMRHLGRAAIAHFACHAASDPVDPSRSMILLHDYRESPLTVLSLASVSLHHAQLAYLSACETARNKVANLADEAIHLTSAFQLVGYPHVIGTLWTISDSVAVQVATSFYSGLGAPEGLDLSRSAEALHYAIRTVRDSDNRRTTPSLWASYTHTGA